MRFWVADAFTDKAFAGNPAAVFLLERELPAEWMQRMARELNLSETAFVLRQGAQLSIRWFTPATEVELCGHATLASVHVMREQGWAQQGEKLSFGSRSGDLRVKVGAGAYELDFPQIATEDCADMGLLPFVNVIPRGGARGKAVNLYEVEKRDLVHRAIPDFAAMQRLPVDNVILTAWVGTPDCDFVSRFFCPKQGIPEDPVTGFGHCVLAPYWARRKGKQAFRAYQASSRGGWLDVELKGERVSLRGGATTVFSAELQAGARPQ